MGTPGEALQHGHPFGPILRLAENFLAQRYRGVGGQNRLDFFRLEATPDTLRLGTRQTHHIVDRRLGRQPRFVDVGNQDLVRHENLPQQGAASG